MKDLHFLDSWSASTFYLNILFKHFVNAFFSGCVCVWVCVCECVLECKGKDHNKLIEHVMIELDSQFSFLVGL